VRRERPARAGRNPAIVARFAVVLVVIAGGVAAWFMSGTDHGATFRHGIEAMSRGDLDTAIACFQSVPVGHNMYSRAQEKIAEARELKASDEVRLDTKKAENLWGVIEQLRKAYVDGLGNRHPEYAPNCRYMLKRAQEFIDTFPDDPRVAEARGLFSYYRDVASLDKPPTEADVRAEVRMRTLTYNFSAGLAVIDEYAEQSGQTDVAEEMRAQLREDALAHWQQMKQQLEQRGVFEPGSENWLRAENTANEFLDSVEGLSGVSADAIALRDRARAARSAGG
jgi:hypothetical protein